MGKTSDGLKGVFLIWLCVGGISVIGVVLMQAIGMWGAIFAAFAVAAYLYWKR